MSSVLQNYAFDDASRARLLLDEWRRRQASQVGMCRADGMDVQPQELNGDYDLDDGFAQQLLARLGSDIEAALVGPTNVPGNSVAAVQIASQAVTERVTRRALEQGAARIASGGTQSVRINRYMTLYNAASRGQRPRIRLRVVGLPVTVVTPVAAASAWRSNARTGRHSTAWNRPSAQAQSAARVAGEAGWSRYGGWMTGRVGTGVLTFAPNAAFDAWNSIEFDMDDRGRRHYRSFDRDKFLISSARSQSGSGVGLAVGMAAGYAAAAALSITGAPLVLIVLGVGLVAQIVWNSTGMGDRAAEATERALGR